MALPAEYPIQIYRGDRWERIFLFREGEEVDGEIVPGDPEDLTGVTVQAKIRKKPKPDSDLLATFTCVVDPDQITNKGRVNVVLLPAETATIPAGVYFWDLQLKRSGSDIQTKLQGEVEVSGQVTEDA